MKQFQVRKKQFVDSEISTIQDKALAEGEVLVKIDRFAYTANNITYAVAGDMIGYWQFFPPTEDKDTEEWGVIPVWGFADVVSSNHDAIPVGDRFYGYFPPATHTVMRPVKVGPSQFLDGSAHRRALPAGYNLYRRLSGEPGYDKKYDNARMVFYPLHLTAFCIVDSLQEHDWYGASQVVVLSASSKTSLGLAVGIHDLDDGPQAIGMTSTKNLDTTNELGVYDQLVSYDQWDSIDMSQPTVIVDMSGNIELVNQLAEKLEGKLAYLIQVGMTHWDKAGQKVNVEKSKKEFFFAPGHMQMRIKQWGPEEFNKKTLAYYMNSSSKISQWMSYKTIEGLEGLAEIHRDVCLGNIPANQGLVVELS